MGATQNFRLIGMLVKANYYKVDILA